MGSYENMLREEGGGLESFLIDGVDPIEPGVEGASLDIYDEYTLSPAEESAIFLDAMASECDSAEEFFDLVEENATAWEMYGIIEDASAALEAVKRMKITNWKQVNTDRIAGNQAIRMAASAKSNDYKKYKKFRTLMLKYKAKIMKRYSAQSKVAARKAIQNSKRKAASVKGSAASGITKKIDHAISGLDKTGRNGKAITEKGR